NRRESPLLSSRRPDVRPPGNDSTRNPILYRKRRWQRLQLRPVPTIRARGLRRGHNERHHDDPRRIPLPTGATRRTTGRRAQRFFLRAARRRGETTSNVDPFAVGPTVHAFGRRGRMEAPVNVSDPNELIGKIRKGLETHMDLRDLRELLVAYAEA